MPDSPSPEPPLRLSGDDLYLFNEGTHYKLYDKLGAHPTVENGAAGTRFAVWAPNAREVSVIGDWNGFTPGRDLLYPRGSSGVFDGFLKGVRPGEKYKYRIVSQHGGYAVDKTDPFGVRQEHPPRTASIVWSLDYAWGDGAYMKTRGKTNSLSSPMSIYEVHLGSFMRVPEQGNRVLNYRELAHKLGEHALELGFTHVELLPVMEHPLTASWGYQVTGYFAPTSRYGTPQDLMYLIDYLHQRGIGVILDWVPAHFPTDQHGLGYFDGTHLYEHDDPRLGFHPDWRSAIFNYGRNEVRAFLISSAMYWLDKYHIDGLRVDGVASMLYRDYSRKEGEWIPNAYGGRENLEAVSLLQEFNRAIYAAYPDVQTIAEESTAWPMVTRPTYVGGLGFGLKWDLGFMHDTLTYMSKEPVHRKYHHNQLTFRSLYATNENFVLPLSHDEVVHGKGALLSKQPGDEWQRFANLRLLYAYMYAQPGKKLLFMGGEIGQYAEWNFDASLDFHLLEYPLHRGVQALVRDLNRIYREQPALHELDCAPDGFRWIDADDGEQSVLSFERRGKGGGPNVVAIFNFTPVIRGHYRVGVDKPGTYRELLNSDAGGYGGGDVGNLGGVDARPEPRHGRPYSLELTLPPLGALYLLGPR